MSIDNFRICPICGTKLNREINCGTDYAYYWKIVSSAKHYIKNGTINGYWSRSKL